MANVLKLQALHAFYLLTCFKRFRYTEIMRTKQQHEEWMAKQYRFERAFAAWLRDGQYTYQGTFAQYLREFERKAEQ
jgi:hypothetical protein